MSSNSSSAASSSFRLVKIEVMPSESALDERDRPCFQPLANQECFGAAAVSPDCLRRRGGVAAAEDAAEKALRFRHVRPPRRGGARGVLPAMRAATMSPGRPVAISDGREMLGVADAAALDEHAPDRAPLGGEMRGKRRRALCAEPRGALLDERRGRAAACARPACPAAARRGRRGG